VVVNHSAEGSQIQTYDFLREPHKQVYHKSIDTFCFIALTKCVTQRIRGITERHCLSKGILWGITERHCLSNGILSQQRIRH